MFPLEQRSRTVFLHDKSCIVGEFRAFYKPYPLPVIQERPFTNSTDVTAYLRPIFELCMEDSEQFVVIYLSKANNPIHYTIASTGGITGTVVDVQIILRHAILLNAKGLILAHNHPSGNLTPSDPDLKVTSKLVSAATFLEMSVLDHIIITNSSYYSFADNGMI